MNEVLECIYRTGLIPVLTISDLSKVSEYGSFFSKSGFECLEITLRTPVALDAISLLKKEFPGLIVGAGTVLNTGDGKKALEAGSDFLVSPGFTVDLLKFSSRNSLCYIPGVQTPAEIQSVLEYGFNILKFFPCEAAGGIKALKALAAPFYSVRFIPTGGINQNNFREYLDLKEVFALGGSFMVPPEKEITGNFESCIPDVESLKKAVNGFCPLWISAGAGDIWKDSLKNPGFIKVLEVLELNGKIPDEKNINKTEGVSNPVSDEKKFWEDSDCKGSSRGKILVSCRQLERAGSILKKSGVAFSLRNLPQSTEKFLCINVSDWEIRIIQRKSGDYCY